MNQQTTLGGLVVAAAIVFLFVPGMVFVGIAGLIGGGAMLFSGLTRDSGA